MGEVNLKIRRMIVSDVDAVIALDRKVFGATSQITYKELASVGLGSPLDMSFVGEIDSTVIGFLLARIVYAGMPFEELCTVHAIMVEPDYRRSGIGSRLFNELINHCQEEGIHRIRTLVDESNNEVRRFFESLGFRRSNSVNYDKIWKS